MKRQGMKALAANCGDRIFQLRPLHIACIVLIVIIIFTVFSHRNNNEIQNPTFSKHLQYADTEDMEALSLDHCKSPTLEKLFPQNYLENYINISFLMEQMTDICSKTPDFSKLENQILSLTDNRYQNCCMSGITRESNDLNDSYVLLPCIDIDGSQGIDVSQQEFIVVTCEDPDSKNLTHNFHANIPITGRLMPRIDEWKGRQSERPYSVFVLVLDSTSRAEMFRSLPLTTKYLLRNLDFVQFNGHHALGEPTQPNALPMLMGIQRYTFQTEYFNFDQPAYWDRTPFIWRIFNELKYFTGYFEDAPEVGTFNYGGQLGFEDQPTTLYIRPLMLAHTRFTEREKKSLEYCFGSKNVVEFMMDYHFRTLESLSEFPTFQITWPCYPQHDIGGSLSFLDNVYLDFFKKVSENRNIMDKTLFIVVSDHGYYNSMNNSYANTHESLIERRNMPLFVRLPDKLKAQHPEFQENLEWNSKVITSHYDIYQTFIHIAQMAGEFQPLSNLQTYGSSLFTKIPQARTCKDARIPKTMCICNLPPPSSDSPATLEDIIIDRSTFFRFDE